MQSISTKKLLLILAGLLVLLAAICSFMFGFKSQPVITNFGECAAAGYPIMESYPEQCRTPDGHTFVRDVPPISGNTENTGNSGEGLGLHANGCAVAGCSGQLCVSADEAGGMVSTCEYRAEYSCYKEASCEPQADGKCGWTQTAALQACLKNPPVLNGVEGPSLDAEVMPQ